MQPAPELTLAPTACGDEGDLYRHRHRDLKRAVSRVVHASPELIEHASKPPGPRCSAHSQSA
jgi:hypothetical protein